MQALFIGQAYIDITFLTDHMPQGDEKHVARDYAVSFGGNAVTAAFATAKLGIKPDLLCSLADDWLGKMFANMASSYGISLHARKVQESSLSFIMPKDGKRAIVRCRDDDYLHPFPHLNMGACRALHLDGHQPEAAMHYAKACREQGIMTSLDGGTLRSNTHDLLHHIDVAVVSELFCEQLKLSPESTLGFLKGKGCRVGAVTLGEQGVVYYEGTQEIRQMPALSVPRENVIDTNGAGDIFHGAYMHAYLDNPEGSWTDHFAHARSASAFAVQHLGNETSLPTLEDMARMREQFPAPLTLSS